MAKTKVHGEFLKDSVVRFTAKAGENITKGQAVYISGVSGEKPVVSLADANDTAKMPAFGLAEATVSTNAEIEITSFGTLKGLDTSSFSLGDILYVDTTAGSLTNNPSGLEATKLQNIGMVQRVHASNGSIKVGGAGRTNAVPNLDDGDIFIGDSNNKAISSPLSTEIESYLDGGTSTPILTSLTVASDTDIAADIGRAKIGYIGFDDFAGFAHRDNATTTNYALLQYNTGETYLNAASGRDINFRINNSNVGMFDSSGNLLVGTTDVDLGFTDGDDGFAVNPAGYVQSARSSTNANLYLNKLDYDGEIINFRKDGSTVGSIGASSGTTYIQGNSNSSGFLFGNSNVYPWDAGALSDGNIELGNASYRWNNIYLSGGAYLGGTGSANHLDDYEEGTWTPVYDGATSASGVAYTTRSGSYTKIGNTVTASCNMVLSNKGTVVGVSRISGLPFAGNNSPAFHVIAPMFGNLDLDANQQGTGAQYALNSFVYLFVTENDTALVQMNNGHVNNNTDFHFTVTYMTNS